MSEVFVPFFTKLPELWFVVLDSPAKDSKTLSPNPPNNYIETGTLNFLTFGTGQVQTSYSLYKHGALTSGVPAQKPPYLTHVA